MSLRVPTPDRLDHGPRRQPEAGGVRRGGQRRVRRGGRRRRRTGACSSTATSRSCRPTSSATRRRASTRRSTRWRTGPMVKVLGWYDNEWGYSNRLVDLVGFIGDRCSAARRTGRSAATMTVDIPRLEDLPKSARVVASCCAPTSTCPLRDGVDRPTTSASRPCCPRSSGCATRARPSSRAVTSAGRRASPTRSTRWRRWRHASASCSTARCRSRRGRRDPTAASMAGEPRGRAT